MMNLREWYTGRDLSAWGREDTAWISEWLDRPSVRPFMWLVWWWWVVVVAMAVAFAPAVLSVVPARGWTPRDGARMRDESGRTRTRRRATLHLPAGRGDGRSDVPWAAFCTRCRCHRLPHPIPLPTVRVMGTCPSQIFTLFAPGGFVEQSPIPLPLSSHSPPITHTVIPSCVTVPACTGLDPCHRPCHRPCEPLPPSLLRCQSILGIPAAAALPPSTTITTTTAMTVPGNRNTQ